MTHKPQPKADRKKPIRCLLEVRKLPIELFIHPAHGGRQWRSHARKLWNLLCELASYANPDGTFGVFSPSIETLVKHHSERSVYRLLDELRDLGLLEWTRENHYVRRTYRITLPSKNTCQTASDSTEDHLPSSRREPENTCQGHEKHLPSVAGETPASSGRYPPLPTRLKEPSKEREPSTEADAPKTGAPDSSSLSRSSTGNGQVDAETKRRVNGLRVSIAKKDLPLTRQVVEVLVRLVDAGVPDHCIVGAASDVPPEDKIPALWLRDNLEARALARWAESQRDAEIARQMAEVEARLRAEAEARIAEAEARQAEELALVGDDPFV